MTQYDNTNKGIFFKNDRKEKDSHPDYKGSINIEGVEYWLSGWIKVNSQDASKRFISLSVQPKQQAVPEPRQAPRQAPKTSHDAARSRQLPQRETFTPNDRDYQNDGDPF